MENEALNYDQLLATCAEFYKAFTGYDCDPAIAELLADGAQDYYAANREGDYDYAEQALLATVGYVNTELTEDEYEQYVDMFSDYLADY